MKTSAGASRRGRANPALRGLAPVVAIVFLFLLPGLASAFPSFSRQVGRDCTYCHNAFPKLNDTGRTFLFNGYRFEAEGEWRDVKDISTIPVSFMVEVEGMYDRIKAGGAVTESSDLKVEAAELMAGGAFGRTGKVTSLAMVVVEQDGDGFDAGIHMAFVQINDLAGRTGAGALNVKAGIGGIGIAFLSPLTTPISNRYLADRVLGVIGSGERFFELNGSFENEGQRVFNHRYRAGISREDVNSDDKLKGAYASWAVSIDEDFSIGAVARAGEERDGSVDVSYKKYGLAAEAEKGPFILTLGYFLSEKTSQSQISDYLAELLYFIDRFTLGARYEVASSSGDRVTSQTYIARYDILRNAVAQFEYRRLDDKDLLAGGGENEDRLRVILTAVF